jgi:hypothetical protein
MDYWFYTNFLADNKRWGTEKANETIEGFSVGSMVGIPGFLASFIISVFTCYLCWNNNKNTNIVLRIIYCIIAFTFSGIYLLYYYLLYYNDGKTDKELFLE